MAYASRGTLRTWMFAAVLSHLAISLVHGSAHQGAEVPLSPAATFFVFAVILAGPLAGLALSWRAERLGAVVVAVTLAGALAFGVVNHFVFQGPDHVRHVRGEWRTLFATTAALLSVTEVTGLALAVRLLQRRVDA